MEQSRTKTLFLLGNVLGTIDGDMRRARAAVEKLPSSTTFNNARMPSKRSIDMLSPIHRKRRELLLRASYSCADGGNNRSSAAAGLGVSWAISM